MARLSKSDIAHKAERWALAMRERAKLDAAKEAAMAPLIKRHADEMQKVLDAHDPKISAVEQKADALYTEVVDWLNSQCKPVAIESRSAIAELLKGEKLRDRVIDVKKFLAYAKRKGDAVYDCVSVGVAKAEKLLGKTELDKISVRPVVPYTKATLRLKD